MRRYPRESLVIGLLLFLSALVYRRVLGCDFVYWDDDVEIYLNPHLKGITPETLRWMFFGTGYVVHYQPLTWLTWQAIYAIQGPAPAGYHLASWLAHGVNTALVFLLIRKLLLLARRTPPDPREQTYLAACAGLGAALWALHPLRVESVAWVSAFLHLQALFFLLLAALGYLEAATRPPGRGRTLLFWSSVAGFFLSLLSYPIGLGFVVAVVVLDVYPLRRLGAPWWKGSARRVWLEKLPFAAAAALVLGITLLLRFNTSSHWARPVSVGEFGWLERVMQACYIWSYYLWRPWAPFGLSPVYTTLVSFHALSAPFLAGLGLVLLLSGVLFRLRHRWPAGLALWICHLAWLVPFLGLTEHPHFPQDRYSLVVGIFWSILAAAGLFHLSGRPRARAAAFPAAGVLLAGLAILTMQQVGIWKDSRALFQAILARLGDDPYRADIYWRLGVLEKREGHPNEALEWLGKALEIRPEHHLAHQLMGDICYGANHFDEARRHYLAAIQSDPSDPESENGLGATLAAQGKWQEAAERFARALKLNPTLSSANFNMGMALARQGRVEEARTYLERAKQSKTKPGGAGP